MLTVADRGEGGDKICLNLADVICERSLIRGHTYLRQDRPTLDRTDPLR